MDPKEYLFICVALAYLVGVLTGYWLKKAVSSKLRYRRVNEC